jgi:hypothetical protein
MALHLALSSALLSTAILFHAQPTSEVLQVPAPYALIWSLHAQFVGSIFLLLVFAVWVYAAPHRSTSEALRLIRCVDAKSMVRDIRGVKGMNADLIIAHTAAMDARARGIDPATLMQNGDGSSMPPMTAAGDRPGSAMVVGDPFRPGSSVGGPRPGSSVAGGRPITSGGGSGAVNAAPIDASAIPSYALGSYDNAFAQSAALSAAAQRGGGLTSSLKMPKPAVDESSAAATRRKNRATVASGGLNQYLSIGALQSLGLPPAPSGVQQSGLSPRSPGSSLAASPLSGVSGVSPNSVLVGASSPHAGGNFAVGSDRRASADGRAMMALMARNVDLQRALAAQGGPPLPNEAGLEPAGRRASLRQQSLRTVQANE